MEQEFSIFIGLFIFTLIMIVVAPFTILKLPLIRDKQAWIVESKMIAFGLPMFAIFSFKTPSLMFGSLGLALLNFILIIMIHNYQDHEIKNEN